MLAGGAGGRGGAGIDARAARHVVAAGLEMRGGSVGLGAVEAFVPEHVGLFAIEHERVAVRVRHRDLRVRFSIRVKLGRGF